MSVKDFIFSREMESAAAFNTAFVVSSLLSSGTYFKMSNNFCNSWSVIQHSERRLFCSAIRMLCDFFLWQKIILLKFPYFPPCIICCDVFPPRNNIKLYCVGDRRPYCHLSHRKWFVSYRVATNSTKSNAHLAHCKFVSLPLLFSEKFFDTFRKWFVSYHNFS